MGLSVAASSAILFVGFILVATVLFAALNVTLMEIEDRYQEAQELQSQRFRTAIKVDNATNNTTSVFINITNTGAITLKISEIQLLVNGTLVPAQNVTNHSIDGNNVTDLWAPEETLYLELDYLATGSERIKVVTGNGIADVEVLS
jgi:archaellum component FlaF (FlaF/FlaG flagellin family)